MVMGAVLVRAKVIRAEDSRSISIISLYLITPCAIFSAFQMTYTPQILKSLILAAVTALILHMIMILLTKLLERRWDWMWSKKHRLFIQIREI